MDDCIDLGKAIEVTRHGETAGPFRDPVIGNCTGHDDDPFDPRCLLF